MMTESTAATVTYLFSDIEGSTRLWETDPAGAARSIAWHDQISRTLVKQHCGQVVKMTGDGMHAAFDDPAEALAAVIDLQLALAQEAPDRARLQLRCGLHMGADERRDNDFFGQAVNRAARIMSAAHGGQILVSKTVASCVADRLPSGVSLRDLGAVRLRDLGSAEHLFQIVHPGLRTEFPPLRSMASTPNNLAQQLNSFVGRQSAMEQVRQLLANSRLLTLMGMGGLGKSRLSLQVAAIVMEDYPDGVWFVELAPLSDPRSVVQAVATAVGVREEPGGTLLDTLARYVRDKKMLIVLDNCEHLVHECAQLVKALLQAGPGLRVLASSRDSLRIAGETVLHLPPLPTPPADPRQTPETLMQLESVRLFVERAAAAQPSFRLNDKNAAAVAEICRRLDGIPLALELAAARTRAMPVERICERLQDRFRLLTSQDRTVLPRQQTLRALIDWSYDLMSSSEQALFRRLSVFSGGWTLEAAESVCGTQGIDTADILDLLANLIEKSLVVLDAEGSRYRMLETVRQYAVERLAQSGEATTLRGRHLDWCIELADNARKELVGKDQARWLDRLDAERDNLLVAHRWCGETDGGATRGLRFVHALKIYWYQRGLLTLGHQLTFESLARTPAQERTVERCQALIDLGQIESFMGRHAEARRHLDESLAIARELDDRSCLAAVLQPLGLASAGMGDLDQAIRYFDEAIAVARSIANPRQLAAALNCRAQVARQQRDFDPAAVLYTEALEIARHQRDAESAAIVQLNLAMIAIEQSKLSEARDHLQQALATALAVGSQALGQAVLDVLAGLCSVTGQHDDAARFFGAAESQAQRSGMQRDSADAAFLVPRIDRSRAALGKEAFNEAGAAGAGWSYGVAMDFARQHLGRPAP
jgi:predicted ATPase/class 3 adenylate cyclase